MPLDDHVLAAGRTDRHSDLDALLEQRELTLYQLPHGGVVRPDLSGKALVLSLEISRRLSPLRGRSLVCRGQELIAPADAKLLKNIAKMSFNGALRDGEPARDLVGLQPAGGEGADLLLAVGERCRHRGVTPDIL